MVDGVCQCPENEVEEDGMCHPKVPCCVDYEDRECIKTTEDTTLVDGECVCADNDAKIDANGQCVPCAVTGCKECIKPDECNKCEGELVLKNGKCVCPERKYLEPDMTCGDCKVPGCKKCAEDSS